MPEGDGETAPLLDQGEAPEAPEGIPSVPMVTDPGMDANGDIQALTKDDALGVGDQLQRGCTDVPCCLLFIVAVLFLGTVHQMAFEEGNPRRVFYGKDHDARVCGLDGDVRDFPYVYYPYKNMEKYGETLLNVKGQGLAISIQMTSLIGVCTKSCPVGGVEMQRDPALCPAKDEKYCSWYGQNNSVYNLRDKYCIFMDPDSSLLRDGTAACHDVKKEATGAVVVLNEKNLQQLEDLKQVVVQADGSLTDVMDSAIENMRQEGEIAEARVEIAVDNTMESCNEDKMEPPWVEALSDLYAVKEMLFCVPLVTFVVGFAYFILLRYCASVVIFGVIGTLIGGGAIGALLLFEMHETYMLEGLDDKSKQCWWASLVAGIFSASILVLVLFSCNTLRMTAAMMKTVSMFLMETPSVLMTVPCMLFFSAAWLLYMVWAGLYLFSTLTINPTNSLAGELTRYDMEKQLMYKCLFHLLMLLWINAIFTGLMMIALAISVRAWYYAKPDESGNKVTPFGIGFSSMWTAFRYHFGSAVFGGLLLAIVQLIRFCLKYIEQQLKNSSSNATTGFIIKCVDWFLWCIQKIVEMINQVAYIIVGLKGYGFFTSAKRGVGLMLANPQRFFTLHSIAVLLEYFGVALSILGSVVFFYGVIEYCELGNQLSSYYSVFMAISIIAALSARVFFSLFTASADAFFFCFIFDEEVAKVTGKSEAEHCPPTLKAFLDDGVKDEDEDADGKKTKGCCGC